MDESSWRPTCKDHGSVGRRVVLDGFVGSEPPRKQRYRCLSTRDKRDYHRFLLVLPRFEALTHECVECESDLATGQGPTVARRYDYASREIASALVHLASGATCMEASRAVRTRLARDLCAHGNARLPWSEHAMNHGQLAANWLEIYADVVLGDDEDRAWPDVVLLDSTSFWRYQGGRRVLAFHLLFAYGYDGRDAPDDPWLLPDPVTGEMTTVNGREVGPGRLLQVRAYSRCDGAAWADFLGTLPGTPEVVVADAAQDIRAGLRLRWPSGSGLRRPEYVRCRWHLLKNLRERIVGDLVTLDTSDAATETKNRRAQEHPLYDAAGAAFHSSDDWHTFRDVASSMLLDHFGGDLPPTLAWLRDNDLLVLCQMARRPERLGPESAGPLEADVHQFRGRLATRAQTLANQDRTNLLLRLMVAGRRGQANEQLWAERVRQYLLTRDGVAPEQRPLVLPSGVRTL